MVLLTSASRASRFAQTCMLRSRGVSEKNRKTLVGATGITLLLGGSGICLSYDILPINMDSLQTQSSYYVSSEAVAASLLSLFWSRRVRCDEGGDVENEENTDDDLGEYEESGYSESERFFQAIDYHRSLLFDYHRRWGPYDPDEKATSSNDRAVNRSRTWPRNIPSSTVVGSLIKDLDFCLRSPTSDAHQCHDLQFRIATYYISLNDTEAQQKGYKIIRKLAEQGHPNGMCYYGIILNEGKIIDPHPQQAVTWWRRCVDNHRHIQATYELATACYLGDGVPENPKQAGGLYHAAAHLGHAGSAYMLGELLLDGVGVERDRANALEWLVTAAELGHQLARRRVITVLYEDYSNLEAGTAEEEQKQAEAAKWINVDVADEMVVKSVNVERRYTIGGGSRNPAIKARRTNKIKESRDEV